MGQHAELLTLHYMRRSMAFCALLHLKLIMLQSDDKKWFRVIFPTWENARCTCSISQYSYRKPLRSMFDVYSPFTWFQSIPKYWYWQLRKNKSISPAPTPDIKIPLIRCGEHTSHTRRTEFNELLRQQLINTYRLHATFLLAGAATSSLQWHIRHSGNKLHCKHQRNVFIYFAFVRPRNSPTTSFMLLFHQSHSVNGNENALDFAKVHRIAIKNNHFYRHTVNASSHDAYQNFIRFAK